MKNKKKTNKQIYTTFVLMIVIGCVVGVVFGFGGAFLSDMYGGDIIGGLHQIFKVTIPIVYILMMVVCYGYSVFHYYKAKKLVENWDGMDEEMLDRAEDILGLSMISNNIMQVSNFFFFSAMTYISEIAIPNIEHIAKNRITMMAVVVGIFILNMVIITVIQKLTIDLTKKINPEKNGNIFDKDFTKDWLASCDEAQKLMIYEAGYKAFQATQMTCIVMWILALIGMLLFDIGIMPSVCVFVIWLTMTISYSIACRNIEKRKSHTNVIG